MSDDELRSKLLELISEQELDDRLNSKVEKLGGLCDRKTAMLLVAHELGINDNGTSIAEIGEDARGVSFAAIVLSVLSVRRFSRDDGSVGQVANLLVGDESGTARVVLWDEVAELVERGEVVEGECYAFTGKMREGRGGRELHIDRWGNITPIKKHINPLFSPTPIASLVVGMEAEVLARVLSLSQVHTFVRKDGSMGEVREAMVADESGSARMVLWGRTASLDVLKVDAVLEIRGVRIKEGRLGPELHVGELAHVAESEKSIQWTPSMTPLSELVAGQMCCVEGMVSGIGELREFRKKDGSIGVVSEVYLSDDGSRVRLVLWEEHANIVEEVDFGERMRVLFCTVREGPELSTTRLSVIKRL